MDSLENSDEPAHRRTQTHIPDKLVAYYDNQRFRHITTLLSKEGIDIRVLENIKQTYLRLHAVYHSLSTHDFETALHNMKWTISTDILDQIISALKSPKGKISSETIESLLKAYKHTLSGRKVYYSNFYIEKNAYSNVYDILNSQGCLNLRRDMHYKIDLLYRRILDKFTNLSKAFINFDQDSDGYLGYDDFLTGVRRVDNLLKECEINDIFKTLDAPGKGYLTFDDFGHLESIKRDLSPPIKLNSTRQSRSTTPHGKTQNAIFRKQLPNENNPQNGYGVALKQTEIMKDILNGTHQKQYLDKLTEYQRQIDVKLKNTVIRNDPTLKTIQRNEAIKQKYINRTLSDRKWRMPKFARVESIVKRNGLEYPGEPISEIKERD